VSATDEAWRAILRDVTPARIVLLALAAAIAVPGASSAAKTCPAGYKKVGIHCTRSTGPPPRGYADTFQGTRGTLRVANHGGSLSARLNWRVTLVCANGSKLPSSRGIEDEIHVGAGRAFSMSVPSSLGTASFTGRWRNRNTISGTLRITGYPKGSTTCAGTFAGSFAFKRRRAA
jgi:hypothetical protein